MKGTTALLRKGLIFTVTVVTIAILVTSTAISYNPNDYVEKTLLLYNFETLDEWLPVGIDVENEIKTTMTTVEDGTVTEEEISITNTYKGASDTLVTNYVIRTEAQNIVRIKYPYRVITNSTPRSLGLFKGNTYNSLRMDVAFSRRGYNYFDIIPKYEKRIPGRVKTLDVWVWAPNYQYRMEMWVEDFLGYLHKIEMGMLNFLGWKNITVEVPAHIPQGERYIPRLKGLRFKYFRVWTEPYERVDRFHIALDYFRAKTDIYRPNYDGDDIEDQLIDQYNMHSEYVDERDPQLAPATN